MWGSSRTRDGVYQNRLPGERTTQKQLATALCEAHTGLSAHGSRLFRYQNPLVKDYNSDEVYPGIHIGDAATAVDTSYLQMLGITHLINAAEGKSFGFVDTDKYYYSGTAIKYLGLPLADLCSTDISRYFYTVASFIEEALSSRRGKVFVHCVVGVSRSATCVLAYLMIKKGMSAVDAIQTVCKHRYVRPNDGFLQQLAQLDNELRANY